MEYVTPMHLAMAIPLTIAATIACMVVYRKLEEKIPGNPLNQLSPEERKARRELILKSGLFMTPFTEEEEQETK